MVLDGFWLICIIGQLKCLNSTWFLTLLVMFFTNSAFVYLIRELFNLKTEFNFSQFASSAAGSLQRSSVLQLDRVEENVEKK